MRIIVGVHVVKHLVRSKYFLGERNGPRREAVARRLPSIEYNTNTCSPNPVPPRRL